MTANSHISIKKDGVLKELNYQEIKISGKDGVEFLKKNKQSSGML